MHAEESTTPAPQSVNLSLLRWIVDQAEQAPAVLGYLEQIITGAAPSDRWAAFKALGDLIVADLANFSPPPAADSATTARLLQALGDHPVVQANGKIIDLVLTNLPQILAAIETILALFGKTPSATGETLSPAA
jgi:hypothetical protein